MSAGTGRRGSLGRRLAFSVLLLLAGAACLLLALWEPWAAPTVQEGSATLTAFDVGQGDALLLCSGGETMLIDAGTRESADALCAALRSRKLRRLDYVVLTHPHSDHYGGMYEVFERFEVGAFLLPDGAERDALLSFAGELCGRNACPIELVSAGRTLTLGNAVVTVLSPEAGAAPDDENDLSLVLDVRCGRVGMLLTGDATQAVLESLELPRCTLFKAAHHGSSGAISEEILRRVRPAYAFISCGAGNEYGHPHEQTLALLADAGTEVFRTDRQGTLTAVVEDGRLRIVTE